MKSPSEKQIKFADEIAKTLNIDFPKGSSDFNAYNYWNFINNHIKEYREIKENPSSYMITVGGIDAIFEDDQDLLWGYDCDLWEY